MNVSETSAVTHSVIEFCSLKFSLLKFFMMKKFWNNKIKKSIQSNSQVTGELTKREITDSIKNTPQQNKPKRKWRQCNILFAQSLMARSAYVKFDMLGTSRNISSATRQPGKHPC